MSWRFPHPSGEITVEEAVVADASAILAVHRDVLAERDWFITLPHEFTGSIDQKIRQIRELGRRQNSVFLVGRQGGRLAGFLTVQGGPLERLAHTGKLEIMVHKDLRRNGIGRTLLRACIEWAEANPVLEKLGLSVFTTNERAIKLYRDHGFVEEGRRLREYKLEDGSYRDDLLMFRPT